MLAMIGVKILFSKYLTLRLYTKSYIYVFIIEMHLDFFPFEILNDSNAILEESQCLPKLDSKSCLTSLAWPIRPIKFILTRITRVAGTTIKWPTHFTAWHVKTN